MFLTPFNSIFFFAKFRDNKFISLAKILAFFLFLAIETAIAPDPVPISIKLNSSSWKVESRT